MAATPGVPAQWLAQAVAAGHSELRDYENADKIVVPARHAEKSFLEEGTPARKLFRNPYGVDLEMFAPTPKPPEAAPPTILMVGRWSLRKGCDLLAEAAEQLSGVRLVHVGTVEDCPLPDRPWFEHYDPVKQSQLREYYTQAHVMALPSREEGLAVVQAQALSCGLRLVCSDRTGGDDLREFLPDPDVVTVVPGGVVGVLVDGLRNSLAAATTEARGLRDRFGGRKHELSWAAYGRRYSRALVADRAAAASSLR